MEERMIIKGTVTDVTAIINRIVEAHGHITIREYLNKMGREVMILN